MFPLTGIWKEFYFVHHPWQHGRNAKQSSGVLHILCLEYDRNIQVCWIFAIALVHKSHF